MATPRKFAIVTGASTGIGLELAHCCADDGFDLFIVADEPEIEAAAADFRRHGIAVDAQADLLSLEGVDKLYEAVGGRQTGRGLGDAFLDQDFQKARHVIDTNIIGTVYPIRKIGNDMRRLDQRRILITDWSLAVNIGTKDLPQFLLICSSGGTQGHQSHSHLFDAGCT